MLAYAAQQRMIRREQSQSEFATPVIPPPTTEDACNPYFRPKRQPEVLFYLLELQQSDRSSFIISDPRDFRDLSYYGGGCQESISIGQSLFSL